MRSILVIEDDADTRELIEMTLRAAGHDVETAANGREALAVLSQIERPLLVLLDLMMPEMNGWEFMAATEHQDLSIIVISAHVVDVKTMVAAASTGRPVGFMTKPINVRNLLEAVDLYGGHPSRPGARSSHVQSPH